MDIAERNILVIIYTCLNLLAFCVFTYDKVTAKAGMGRIPEKTLLAFAASGPIGALISMIVFRHKTRHVKFFLVPILLLLHAFLFFWLWPQVRG